ncbi:MAG: homoserine dehydrogenase [Chloroflexi bacterium]|nr:homoserine dehydrogenase [Chloroflexota bacterium]
MSTQERYQGLPRTKFAEVRVGLLGLGTVGSGVAEILTRKRADIEREIGLPIRLSRVLVRDVEKRRGFAVDPGLLTTNPDDILANPAINMVVEVMGNEEPAGSYLKRAIEAGKQVVTANKELVAKQGASLLALAAAKNVDFHYEASVGGGIPLIGPFKQDLAANQLSSVKAIINGTTNYILTRMADGEVEFAEALAEAQELGYAEPDPANDVEGTDAVYKIAILSTLAFHTQVRPDQIYREGITRLTARDFRYAREMGYTIKLLALAAEAGGEVEVRVHPTLLDSHALLARVDGVYNAVQVEGDLVGKVMFTGRGAGPMPTASAVIADVIDIAQDVQREMGFITPVIHYDDKKRLKPMDEVCTRFFIRIEALDEPGALAKIAQTLSQGQISIASIVQKEVDDAARSAEIVLITHTVTEGAVRQALDQLRQLSAVHSIGSVIRIEEEES